MWLTNPARVTSPDGEVVGRMMINVDDRREVCRSFKFSKCTVRGYILQKTRITLVHPPQNIISREGALRSSLAAVTILLPFFLPGTTTTSSKIGAGQIPHPGGLDGYHTYDKVDLNIAEFPIKTLVMVVSPQL